VENEVGTFNAALMARNIGSIPGGGRREMGRSNLPHRSRPGSKDDFRADFNVGNAIGDTS